jgi:hypothetical protein
MAYPSQAKKEAKVQHLVNIEHIAREWHDNQKLSLTCRHADYVLRRLEADIFHSLDARTVNEITPPELLSVLRTILKPYAQ